jgi:hypothetical protein
MLAKLQLKDEKKMNFLNLLDEKLKAKKKK